MNYEMDYHPSTRVGQYVWDIDIESMGIDELDALAEIASEMKAKRENERKLLEHLKRVLDKAAAAGYCFCYETEDVYIDLNNAASHSLIKIQER